MKYQDFVGEVRRRGGYEDDKAAEAMTEVVLSTLAERIGHEEALHFSAQLPKELKAPLCAVGKEPRLLRGPALRFDLAEFYNRVKSRSGCSLTRAERGARAVGSVLREAVAEGDLAHAMSLLSRDYEQLFAPAAPPQGTP